MAGKLTLKYRLILGGIAAVFIPLFIAGIVIYIQLSNSLLEMTKEKLAYIARDTADFIDATLMQEIKLASAIAMDLDVIQASLTGDYRVAQKDLESIHKRIGGGYATIFLLDKNGIARAEPMFPQQIGLDLSDRKYFLDAKEGRISVVGPLPARGTVSPGVPIVLVCVPITRDREFLGAVTMAFNAQFLVEILSKKKSGRTGYAFLMNSEGLVLIHPRKEFMLSLRLLDLPETDEIKRIVQGEKTGTAFYEFEGHAQIAGMTEVPLTGWIVAFTQNRDEIFAPMNRIISAILIVGVIFMVIAASMIIFFSGKISHPLQKMMEMMQQVTRHSNEMIVQIGYDRKVMHANPAYEKITGLKSEDIVGHALRMDTPHNTTESALWKSLESGIPWAGRIDVKGTNRDSMTLDVTILPLRDERGAIQGYLEIGRDITSELMYENRLRQAQKLEAIGTLAGGIAHDFNNILSGIFGYAELSLMKLESDPELEQYISQIIVASERARDLVGQILTFSRKSDVELRPLSPRFVLSEALKLLRASIPTTIDIRTNLNSDCCIMAEPTQIHQVVMNLFTNAVHAIGDHIGTIKLDLEDFFVDEEFIKAHPIIQQGQHIVIRVTDSGKGMEPEIMDHIFDPFFTTKSQGQGTGLGLSVVHGIVNKLNGIVTVYSEPEKGAVFTIIIPCIESNENDGQPGRIDDR